MKKSRQPYFVLILRALKQIEQYQPSTKAEFLEHTMAQDAILMRLQGIGENLASIRHLDEGAFSSNAPESWHKLIGLRNVISHGYDRIDWARIWLILTEELADFRVTIQAVLDDPRSPAG